MNSLRGGPRPNLRRDDVHVADSYIEGVADTAELFDTTDVETTILGVRFGKGTSTVTIDVQLEARLGGNDRIPYGSYTLTESGYIKVDNYGAAIRPVVSDIEDAFGGDLTPRDNDGGLGHLRGVCATADHFYVAYTTGIRRYARGNWAHDSTWTCSYTSGNGNPAAAGIIATDGSYLYVADEHDNKSYAYAIADGTYTSGRDIGWTTRNDQHSGTYCDGTTLWIGDAYDRRWYAYDVATRGRDISKEFRVQMFHGDWGGGAFDGTTVWALYDTDSGGYTIDRIRAYTPTIGDVVNEAPPTPGKEDLVWTGGAEDTRHPHALIDNFLYSYNNPLTATFVGETSELAAHAGVDIYAVSGPTKC